MEHDARVIMQSRPYQQGTSGGSTSHNGSTNGEQPVMPYCLKKALDEPPVPPLSPPGSDETRSLQETSHVPPPPHHQQQQQPPDDSIPSHLIRVDVSNWMKTEEPLISNLDSIAMGNYPALGVNTQFPLLAPTITGGLDGSASSDPSYTMPYVIQDEDWRGMWPQNSQPMS